MANINDLPDEVLEFIMSYLPPYQDLDSCSVVCRRWTMIVKNVMKYTKMNLNKGLSEYNVCWKHAVVPQTLATITARFSHSAVVHGHSMYVFGGRSSATTTFNDLWCFDLSQRQWIRQLPKGTYPSPKGCASLVNHNGYLILFGGLRHPSGGYYQAVKLFNELHVYDIGENRWTHHISAISPPPSAGHSASIRLNEMIIFGGLETVVEELASSNNVWRLDLNTFTWHKQETSRLKPPPRYGQFQLTLDDDHILVMGGCGGPNNVFSDAWLLTMRGDVWEWRPIEIKNKKWSATHMWCNPAARVGSKLVVLGPTPAAPNDLSIIKQQAVQNPTGGNGLFRNGGGGGPGIGLGGGMGVNRRHMPPDDRPGGGGGGGVAGHRIAPSIRNRPGFPIASVAAGSGASVVGSNSSNNNNQQNGNNRNNDEASARLQRNLQQLRHRDDEHLLPKRFHEPFQDRLGMFAFNTNMDRSNLASRERQLERLQRMQNKYHEIRQANQQQKAVECISPKRVRRNCMAMFVCDLSQLLTATPSLEWLEFKNYGIASGAPERLILSSMVAGKGELIMFGGLLKESLTSGNVHVSNSVHFLTVPQGII